ncbi:unnamed protein product [Phyllotreta striolata]|uniref:Gustatory receptor n=1 Tax=Phyllotreta striolata TaxID=444603 RepID=A0A9N9TGL6_PHYSR|nr:unnamed protein product [Phyllotreta striolata]
MLPSESKLHYLFEPNNGVKPEEINTDVYVIQMYHKIGFFFGLTCIGKNSRPTVWNIISNVLFSLTASFASVFSLSNRIDNEWRISRPSLIILEFVELVLEWLWMVLCFVGASSNIKHWNSLFLDIDGVDRILKHDGGLSKATALKHIILLVFFVIVYCLLHYFEIFMWDLQFRMEAGYVFYRIIMLYQFFIVLFSINLTRLLHARYEIVLGSLSEIISGEYAIIQANYGSCKTLVEMKEAMLRLHNVIQKYNVIFGWLIFLNTISAFLASLGDIDYVLLYYGTGDSYFNYGIIAANLVYVLAYSISTILIVFSCDKVNKTARKIVILCYLKPGLLNKTPIRDDLVSFVQFAEKLLPNFSAAGFFYINQTILSTLFSAISTYLIIIIQFNSAL